MYTFLACGAHGAIDRDEDRMIWQARERGQRYIEFYVISAHDVLFAHPLLRPKAIWEGIYKYSILPLLIQVTDEQSF